MTVGTHRQVSAEYGKNTVSEHYLFICNTVTRIYLVWIFGPSVFLKILSTF